MPEAGPHLEPGTSDPLALDPETMRELGYRTVDMLIDHLGAVPGRPALQRATPDEMRERLAPPIAEAQDFEALLEQLERDVLPYRGACDHPGYFAFVPACSTFPAALGDFIASALNIYAGSWMEAAGPSQMELVVLDRFKEWLGYPSGAAGILVSGGSAANMTALACAREQVTPNELERAVAYVSDQAHSSIARAARALGLRPDQLRVLPTDDDHRLRLDALAGAIAADRHHGRLPLMVAASAGSTNTGAIDPLPEIADVCTEAGLWLHVDAAYGGFAALTERGSEWLAGIERADSVTLDPHKWLYQPFECGCLLVREGERLRAAFEIAPDYLKDAVTHGREVNFSDLGFQLTRSCRALKLWLSLGYFGIDAFREAIDRSLDLAALAEQLISERPELDLLSPARLGIVCFRRRFSDSDEEWRSARRNAALVGRFEESGLGLVSSTQLEGTYAIRMCILNHTTGERDVRRAVEWFAETPVPPLSDPSIELALSIEDRDSSVADGWSGPQDFAPEEIAALPLFAHVAPDQVARAAAWAREENVPAGQTVVERWDGAREFYVIIEGDAEVRLGDGDEWVRDLSAGDFFGEVAALDWGAGFGYVRTATVIATSDMRLLAIDPARLDRLMRAAPALDARVRSAAHEHLRRT